MGARVLQNVQAICEIIDNYIKHIKHTSMFNINLIRNHPQTSPNLSCVYCLD